MSRPVATDRHARRRQETRTKLTEAAKALFARQGVEATSISEITDEADVGFGSFYNHFDGKAEIVEAVLAEAIGAQAAQVERLTRDLEDPAEVFSVAHRYFVRQAREDPDWGWLLLRLDISHDIVVQALGPYAARDLRRGVQAGRFQVADEAVTLHAAGGALLGVMRAVLGGRVAKRADVHHAEGMLRLLGLPADEAREIAGRRFPTRRAS